MGFSPTGNQPGIRHTLAANEWEKPVTTGLTAVLFLNEELYHNIKVLYTAHVLAKRTQKGAEAVVLWTNDYNGTKVLNPTIGHNNKTVEDARYLDLVTRGILWTCGKIDKTGAGANRYGLVDAKVKE